jgi:hypothetical protein
MRQKQRFAAVDATVIRSNPNMKDRRKNIDHVFPPCFRCHVLSIVVQPQQGFWRFLRFSVFPYLWPVAGGGLWVSQ